MDQLAAATIVLHERRRLESRALWLAGLDGLFMFDTRIDWIENALNDHAHNMSLPT